MWFIYLFI